jgi:phosphoribosylglycinamide formyltransferase 1
LQFARSQGIATAVVDHKAQASREAFDQALAETIGTHAPDLLLLAGFMRILGPAFVRRYEGRMLNIHPSLLPAFPGLHTHRRVLEAGCKLSGATVHFVTSSLDLGPIVMQSVVPVKADDSEETLATRVLASEHRIYPLSVSWFVRGLLRIERGVVRQTEGASQLLI